MSYRIRISFIDIRVSVDSLSSKLKKNKEERTQSAPTAVEGREAGGVRRKRMITRFMYVGKLPLK